MTADQTDGRANRVISRVHFRLEIVLRSPGVGCCELCHRQHRQGQGEPGRHNRSRGHSQVNQKKITSVVSPRTSDSRNVYTLKIRRLVRKLMDFTQVNESSNRMSNACYVIRSDDTLLELTICPTIR